MDSHSGHVLNGATNAAVVCIANWMNGKGKDPFGLKPDSTEHARTYLENMVRDFGSDAVKAGIAVTQTKIADGDVLTSPLRYFCQAVRRIHSEEKNSCQSGNPSDKLTTQRDEELRDFMSRRMAGDMT